MDFKGRLSTPVTKVQMLKSGFSKLELNADMEKTIKTPESERTKKSRYFALLNAQIGRETIELSYIMVK